MRASVAWMLWSWLAMAFTVRGSRGSLSLVPEKPATCTPSGQLALRRCRNQYHEAPLKMSLPTKQMCRSGDGPKS